MGEPRAPPTESLALHAHLSLRLVWECVRSDQHGGGRLSPPPAAPWPAPHAPPGLQCREEWPSENTVHHRGPHSVVGVWKCRRVPSMQHSVEESFSLCPGHQVEPDPSPVEAEPCPGPPASRRHAEQCGPLGPCPQGRPPAPAAALPYTQVLPEPEGTAVVFSACPWYWGLPLSSAAVPLSPCGPRELLSTELSSHHYPVVLQESPGSAVVPHTPRDPLQMPGEEGCAPHYLSTPL
ncbi:hypothetical protein FKM82_025583 [Ascaphus truei]